MGVKPRTAPAAVAPAKFYDLERDGITFSLLSTFRDCREKARLFLQGWDSNTKGFPIVFGNVVHAALEHAYRARRDGQFTGAPPRAFVLAELDRLDRVFKDENPRMTAETRTDLELSLAMGQELMPRYFSHWAKNDNDLTWLETEQEFRLPWTVTLPPVKNARTGKWFEPQVHTFLRGKIDGIFQEGRHIGVFETKTKGRVDPGLLLSQLGHNLQVSIYLLVSWLLFKRKPDRVIYNIVRRPQLRQKQNESLLQFAKRVGEDIDERADFYFMRLRMELEANDLDRMRADLDDLIQDFVLWYMGHAGHYKNDGHCENKYGSCPFLPICGEGRYQDYHRRPKVFSELEEV